MKAKTIIELLTLSSNLYLISKDKDLVNNLSEMTNKGKEKFNEFIDDFSTDDKPLTEKIMQKAEEAKEEIEHKIEELVVKVYEKMNIAHTNQIKNLETQYENLKRELALTEAKLINLETLIK